MQMLSHMNEIFCQSHVPTCWTVDRLVGKGRNPSNTRSGDLDDVVRSVAELRLDRDNTNVFSCGINLKLSVSLCPMCYYACYLALQAIRVSIFSISEGSNYARSAQHLKH